MLNLNEKIICTNDPKEFSMKQWLTELTNYSPQEIDIVISKIALTQNTSNTQ